MAIDTMKKGSIEMLVLFLLCEGDAYGYQLAQQIKERSGGVLSVQERAPSTPCSTGWPTTASSRARRPL